MNIAKVDYSANHINPTWIYITWDILIGSEWEKTGGDPAIYYELQWDMGSLGENWVVLTTQTQAINTNFNHTLTSPLLSGSMQKYRLRAKNGVGIGLYSEDLDVQADKVPQFMNIPKVDYLANHINPLWI